MQDWHAFHSAFILITSPAKKSTAKGKPKCKKIAHLVYLGYFCGILDHCERKYVPN